MTGRRPTTMSRSRTRLAGRWPDAGCRRGSAASRRCTLLAEHLPGDAEPDEVVVGIETDRGPWVQALLAAGYQVYAINPLSASRYLRAARHLPGQERPPGRQGPGRPGPHRPPAPPADRRRQRARRSGQGAGPHPPEPDLDPAAADQRAALDAARVLPGGAGRLRRPGSPAGPRPRW